MHNQLITYCAKTTTKWYCFQASNGSTFVAAKSLIPSLIAISITNAGNADLFVS